MLIYKIPFHYQVTLLIIASYKIKNYIKYNWNILHISMIKKISINVSKNLSSPSAFALKQNLYGIITD